jgi:hypothetical protein
MCRFITILALATAATAQTAGNGQGTLIVNGNRHELKYARAATLPDEIDKGKEMLRVMVSDAPFPSEAMFHDVDLMMLGSDGQINGVQLDFHADGLVWLLRSSDSKASFSHSQSPNPFPAKTLGGKAEGTMTASQKAESNVEIAVEVSLKYSAPIEKFVPEVEPTVADAEAAKRNPAAIAYLGFADAIQKGDRTRLVAMLLPDKREKIDNEHFPEIIKMIQSMEPSEVRIRKAAEKNGDATLWVTGKTPGGDQKGKITLHLVDGKWIVQNEEWGN